MAVIPSKPNTKLMWASQGNRAEPTSDKQLEGWTQEIPPHEMENWVQYKQDLAIKYLYQEGIPEWDSSFEYNTTSYVKYNGVIYKLAETAEVPNIGKQPNVSTTSWEIAFEPYGASSPLAEEIRKIKELEGYLSLYVSKANPVMNGIATAPEFQATANGGHTFQGGGTDTGMFLNSNNEPEFRINNAPKAVVRNTLSESIFDKSLVTSEFLKIFLDRNTAEHETFSNQIAAILSSIAALDVEIDLSANKGYVKFPFGLMIQWGNQGANTLATGSIEFTKRFFESPYYMSCSAIHDTPINDGQMAVTKIRTVNSSGFIYASGVESGGNDVFNSTAIPFTWLAIGRA